MYFKPYRDRVQARFISIPDTIPKTLVWKGTRVKIRDIVSEVSQYASLASIQKWSLSFLMRFRDSFRAMKHSSGAPWCILKDIEDSIGDFSSYPHYIQMLFWGDIFHKERPIIAAFIYINGLNPTIFVEFLEARGLYNIDQRVAEILSFHKEFELDPRKYPKLYGFNVAMNRYELLDGTPKFYTQDQSSVKLDVKDQMADDDDQSLVSAVELFERETFCHPDFLEGDVEEAAGTDISAMSSRDSWHGIHFDSDDMADRKLTQVSFDQVGDSGNTVENSLGQPAENNTPTSISNSQMSIDSALLYLASEEYEKEIAHQGVDQTYFTGQEGRQEIVIPAVSVAAIPCTVVSHSLLPATLSYTPIVPNWDLGISGSPVIDSAATQNAVTAITSVSEQSTDTHKLPQLPSLPSSLPDCPNWDLGMSPSIQSGSQHSSENAFAVIPIVSEAVSEEANNATWPPLPSLPSSFPDGPNWDLIMSPSIAAESGSQFLSEVTCEQNNSQFSVPVPSEFVLVDTAGPGPDPDSTSTSDVQQVYGSTIEHTEVVDNSADTSAQLSPRPSPQCRSCQSPVSAEIKSTVQQPKLARKKKITKRTVVTENFMVDERNKRQILLYPGCKVEISPRQYFSLLFKKNKKVVSEEETEVDLTSSQEDSFTSVIEKEVFQGSQGHH